MDFSNIFISLLSGLAPLKAHLKDSVFLLVVTEGEEGQMEIKTFNSQLNELKHAHSTTAVFTALLIPEGHCSR